MKKPKGKDQYVKAVEYSHTLEKLLIMERENSAALRDELGAAERERAALRSDVELGMQLIKRMERQVLDYQAEIARRDAAASKPTAWVCGDDEIRDFKAGREVTIVRDCDDSDLEYLPLYLTAPPAVLPPLKKITASVPTDWHKGVVCGWNGCIEMALRLGTQQQKPVFLPAERFCAAEYAGSLLWAETEVWNKAIYECAASLDAANIQYELKK